MDSHDLGLGNNDNHTDQSMTTVTVAIELTYTAYSIGMSTDGSTVLVNSNQW